jgi:hypothetical protein
LSAYQAIVQRRLQRDSLVPVLCLTAQAFLFQFALDSSKGPAARATASLLSCLTALTCIQFMARHRLAEVRDSRQLECMERLVLRLESPLPHEAPKYSFAPDGRGAALGFSTRTWPARCAAWVLFESGKWKAFLVWAGGLAVFAGVGVGAFADSVWSWIRLS